MPDALEPDGQHMQQKACDEFAARQTPRAFPAIGIGATAERHLVVLDTDDAFIGNRQPVRIAARILQHRLRPAQRLLGIDQGLRTRTS